MLAAQTAQMLAAGPLVPSSLAVGQQLAGTESNMSSVNEMCPSKALPGLT